MAMTVLDVSTVRVCHIFANYRSKKSVLRIPIKLNNLKTDLVFSFGTVTL